MKNFRTYGKKPFTMAVVHGGPGCPGQMAAFARELASLAGVLEPLQTADSIDGQAAELAAVLKEHGETPVTLIGWSWGATLSYITAARYPALIRKLVLVGTPPFEETYMASIESKRLLRLKEAEREEIFSLEKSVWDGADEDKSASMRRLFRMLAKADSYAPLRQKDEVLEYQLQINIAVGLEMRRLLADGALIKSGKQIKCPVTAIHGDYDPRPAGGVREPLSYVIKDFKFILLEKCGHEPWAERFARDKFFKVLREEIS